MAYTASMIEHITNNNPIIAVALKEGFVFETTFPVSINAGLRNKNPARSDANEKLATTFFDFIFDILY